MTKLWAPMVAVAMILAAVTIAFLYVVPIHVIKLLGDMSAPVSATRPAEAEQTPAALYRNPDDPPAHQMSASAMPRPGPAPQPAVPSDPEDSSPSASEQRSFKSRRALETIDPRQFQR